MKVKNLTLLFALGMLSHNCTNDDNTQTQFDSTAVISGLDATLCGCCGGYIITIDGEEGSNRFSELPQNAEIDLQNVEFPLTVQLNWTDSNEFCGNGIVVQSIELLE